MSTKQIRVLGIDPSYTCTGLVVLEGKSKPCVSSYKQLKLPTGSRRMLRAAKGLHAFLVGAGALDLAVIEDAAYGAPSRIVIGKLKELSGVYKLVLESHDIPWLEISPSKCKKEITGKGTSEKFIVARELETLFGIHFENDAGFDLSDAAGLAVWGWRHLRGTNGHS